MKQLITRTNEGIQITPVDSILRVTFDKENRASTMTVYLKNGTFYEANEVLIDVNINTSTNYIAKFYSKQSKYLDHKNCAHDIRFKWVGECIYLISYYILNN